MNPKKRMSSYRIHIASAFYILILSRNKYRPKTTTTS